MSATRMPVNETGRGVRDPRLTLISNDARGAPTLTRRKYDAIVSQPSHPWTAGASHLYTLEFMQPARERFSQPTLALHGLRARDEVALKLRAHIRRPQL
jgi:spermidine synthase